MTAPAMPPRDALRQQIVDALAGVMPLGRPIDPHDFDAAADAVLGLIFTAGPGMPCTGCRHADGRSGQWPHAIFCEVGGRLPAAWMRKTDDPIRCGPAAKLYEPKERD